MIQRIWAAVALTAALAVAQVNVTSVTGIITDPTGAAVPGATVTVTNNATGAKFTAASNDRGEYVVPSIPAGGYLLTATKSGFKTASVPNVRLIVGVAGTLNITLELGQTSETIEVSAGADVVQATTADVNTNLTGKQLTELPFATRNAIELLVNAPGTQTPGNPRSSTINGMPKGALNVTIDGMNTQDNNLKSSDGYFSYIYPSVDAVEEVTMQTSAAGVDSTSQGGAQVKFVTRSGTNDWHGGTFWQDRNTFFNANFYYNNQVGLPRDIVKLNQFGAHIGGPIIKNKLFFFGNWESYRYPGTNLYNRTYLTPSASSGVYTYKDNTGALRNVNLLQLAAQNPAPAGARAYPTTADPLLAKTYGMMQQLGANGQVRNNQSGNDYNTLTTSYQPNGTDSRDFYTSRIDYNISSNHTLSFVYNYDKYVSIPDFLNGIVPIFPGGGTVLGTNVNTGQRSNRFDGTLSLRSVISPSMTNEFRGGVNGGTVLFFDAIAPGMFSPWRGYYPSFASPGTGLSTVTTTVSPQRRNAPVKNVADTVTKVIGSHQISFGGNFDQINLWQQIVGRAMIPNIGFGIAANDPIFNGSTNIFNSANLPGSTPTQQQQAANLYADVTGRVSSITQQRVLDEKTKQYAATAPIDRDHMREYGLFVQDQWRVRPNLTATIGLRLEKQLAFVNENGLYSAVDYAGLWGVSGVGNLFNPGTMPGAAPVYTNITTSPYDPPPVWAPSVGLAWQLPVKDGFWRIFTGNHTGAAVLRGGYSIATVREGMNVYRSLFASNQGITIDASVSPTTYPADFGPGGSVNFSDTTLPSRVSSLPKTPSYPIPALFTNSLNGFDPNLKMGYVQSWNLSYQREFGKDTVVDFRFNGNHGTDLWRQLDLNETNILENGFLNEFQIAQNNLRVARGGDINHLGTNNYGNQGLPGQKDIPIIKTAIGTTDTTTATQLMMGQAGAMATGIATNSVRMGKLTGAGYPANFFVVNPTVGYGGSYLLANLGASYYDAGTIEVRRRMASGILFQGSYTFAKALAMGSENSSTDYNTPTTLRNLSLDKGPGPFDIRQAVKMDWIYQLPFGPGQHFSPSNRILSKIVEGWQIAGVARIQSGTPIFFNGLGTFNSSGTSAGSGVVLHNITRQQLQDMVGVYKTSLPGPNGGIVYYLPPPSTTSTAGLGSSNNTNLIYNTEAAFNTGGLTPAQVDPNAPYIGPAAAGQLGGQLYVYAPWQRHFDMNVQKEIRIHERFNLQLRVSALDVLNMTNFIPPSGGNTGATFGQLGPGNAYRDISGTVDPGARIIEFLVRLNF